MNTGMAISFIIGGLLLISIIAFNSRVIENSGETVLNMSAKKHVETVTQVMTRDFLRIGYNTDEEPGKALKFISAQKIVFEADIDNDDSPSPVRITWKTLPSDSISATQNPNDFKLVRQVDSGPEQGTTVFPVTDFEFSFLNEAGSPTADPQAVKSIRVAMETEAPARYGNQNEYERAFWNKTFTPPNLNMYRYK